MWRKRMLATLVIVAFVGAASAQDAARGLCDSGAQRERRTQQYDVETRRDTDEMFVARAPCSNEPISIKRCSVTGVLGLKVQRFCHGGDRPAYYVIVDTVDYWESPSAPKPD